MGSHEQGGARAPKQKDSAQIQDRDAGQPQRAKWKDWWYHHKKTKPKDRKKLLVWFDPGDTRTLIINENGDFVGLRDKSDRAHELFQGLEKCRKDRQP